MGADQGSAMRRKLAAGAGERADTGGPGRMLRFALARAAQDEMTLPLEVVEISQVRCSLAELLDMPPERGLMAMLEGPDEALGLVVLGPHVLAAMIEMQTMGRVSSADPSPRKPTRTDAAMVAGFIDRALHGFEAESEDGPDVAWAGGYRYASFLEDPRPLGLLLEDVAYRVFRVQVKLAGGARTGDLLLALPAEGRQAAATIAATTPDEAMDQSFRSDLTAQVEASHGVLVAVLHRMTVPLSAVMGLQVGETIPLPMAALERVMLEGVDGRRLAEGRLGQNRGMRAVRLVLAEPAAAASGLRLAATG